MPLNFKFMYMCTCVQLFVTLWSVVRHVPLSMEILQARILEWVAMPSSRGYSWPRNLTQVSCIAGRFFTCWATCGRLPLPHIRGSIICVFVYTYIYMEKTNQNGNSHKIKTSKSLKPVYSRENTVLLTWKAKQPCWLVKIPSFKRNKKIQKRLRGMNLWWKHNWGVYKMFSLSCRIKLVTISNLCAT